MFAYLNDKTFTIQSLIADTESPSKAFAVLDGGATTASELSDAGVMDYGLNIPGLRMPVVIDSAFGPIYAYLTYVMLDGSDCTVGFSTAPDSTVQMPAVAETSVPCRVQLHAHALEALAADFSTEFLEPSSSTFSSIRCGRTYRLSYPALTTVTLAALPDSAGVFWFYSNDLVYLAFDIDAALSAASGKIHLYGNGVSFDTSGALPKVLAQGFTKCVWEGVNLHVFLMPSTDQYPIPAP